MICEAFTYDWLVIAGTLSFALGTTMTLAISHFYDSTDGTLKKQEEDIHYLSQKIDKIHSQYERDMLTILRETLRPSSSQRSIVSDVTDVREDEEPAVMDNNSIPGGPSGPN